MEGFNFDQVTGLASLLQKCDKVEAPSSVQQNPNQVSGGVKVVTRGQSNQTEKETKPTSNDIWAEEEIKNEEDIRDLNDKRPTPHYEILYKQSVGTEDTFLGMSDKTPASQDCSHLCIKVHFPNSKLSDLNVDVKKNRILAESKTLRLFTYLPVSVEEDKGVAKFDAAKSILSVTLPIIREFNF